MVILSCLLSNKHWQSTTCRSMVGWVVVYMLNAISVHFAFRACNIVIDVADKEDLEPHCCSPVKEVGSVDKSGVQTKSGVFNSSDAAPCTQCRIDKISQYKIEEQTIFTAL